MYSAQLTSYQLHLQFIMVLPRSYTVNFGDSSCTEAEDMVIPSFRNMTISIWERYNVKDSYRFVHLRLIVVIMLAP